MAKKKPSKRGDWRGVYEALADDPEFQALGADAQLIFYTLKLMLGPSGIDVVRALEPTLSVMLPGVPLEGELLDMGDGIGDGIPYGIHHGMNQLRERGWVWDQGSVVWIRNALEYETSLSIKNKNHKASVLNHLRSLPKIGIVNTFAEYYGLERPFGDFHIRWDPPCHTGWPCPTLRGRDPGRGADGIPHAPPQPGTGTGKGTGKGEEQKAGSNDPGAEGPDSYPQRRDRFARLLMPIVRGVNGQPGLYGSSQRPGHGRSEAQDVDTLEQLHTRHGLAIDELEAMILGAVMMREDGECSFANPGDPLTTGAFFIAGKGTRPFIRQAIDYYHRHAGDERHAELVRWRKEDG